MARLFFDIGRRILISRSNRNVRGGLIVFLAHLLLLASIIFALEIILILLGIGNVFIPLTYGAAGMLSDLVF